VKYDETIYTITVTLKDNGKGKLDVTKVIDNGGKLKFVNEQRSAETSITLGGVKTLEGQELKSGMFSFVLKDQSGKWVGSASNDANGNFTFGKITYKLADLKGERKRVYTYKIAEVKGSKSGIIYDTRVYTVTVTVTDNGDGTMTAKADTARSDVRFVNKTETKKPKKKDSTRTGDEAPLGVLFGGLGIGVVGLAVLLEDRRRKNKKG
jgi:pilin isopeptide linkage protein